MCQVLVGIGTGMFTQCGQLALMSVLTHQEIAVALALFGLFGSIGVAIGNAIAGALWTNILPVELGKNLPSDVADQLATIYGSIEVQLSYPMDSPVRDAIISAYGVVQHKMVIAGSAFVPVFVLCIFLYRNINVKDKLSQTKGNVF